MENPQQGANSLPEKPSEGGPCGEAIQPAPDMHAFLHQRLEVMRGRRISLRRRSRVRRLLLPELRSVVFRPWFWLAFQATLLSVVFEVSGRLQVHTPDNNSDDQEYLDLSKVPFTELISSPKYLGGYRTLGYPIFLQCIAVFSPSLAALPHCQLALHVAAVCAFYWGLRQLGFSGWLAMACASTLLYPGLILLNNATSIDGRPLTYVQCMVTDPAASSLAILTVGMLLWVIGRSRSILAWFGLTVCLFLTYQFRPAYLFLLLLVPLLGLLIGGSVSRPMRFRRRMALGFGLVAVCSLPFLGFCTYRWAKVGQFGLTSFGGFTAIQVLGQFLTDDLIPELPVAVQPLALKGLENRQKLVRGEIPSSFQPVPPFPKSADQLRLVARWRLPTGELQDGDSFQILDDQMSICLVTSLDIFWPAALELYGTTTEANSKLSQLSWAIFKTRPALYFTWVATAFWIAIIVVLTGNFILKFLTALLVLVFGLWLVCYVFDGLRLGRATPMGAPIAARGYFFEMRVVIPIAICFLFAKMILIIMINIPVHRYMEPAGVFLPMIPAVLLFAFGRNIHARLLRGSR